ALACPWIAGHDREDQMLLLLGSLVLAEVQLRVVAVVRKRVELPPEVAAIPVRERRRFAGQQEDATDHQCSCDQVSDLRDEPPAELAREELPGKRRLAGYAD